MTAPRPLFDRKQLDHNRRRARLWNRDRFLHNIAVDELKERLTEINRSFTSPIVVSAWPELAETLISDAPVVTDGEGLCLKPESFDLVLHLFGLHWSEDPVGQLIQCRHALRPDGLFLAVTFGSETLKELRAALLAAETRLAGGASPRVIPMADTRDWGGLLQRAGLNLPVADRFLQTVSYQSIKDLADDLRAHGETNALIGRNRNVAPKQLFQEAEAIYKAGLQRLSASFEFIFLTGWKPHDSQQKPLKPGSAVTRLADALKPNETARQAAPLAKQPSNPDE